MENEDAFQDFFDRLLTMISDYFNRKRPVSEEVFRATQIHLGEAQPFKGIFFLAHYPVRLSHRATPLSV